MSSFFMQCVAFHYAMTGYFYFLSISYVCFEKVLFIAQYGKFVRGLVKIFGAVQILPENAAAQGRAA